MAGLNGGGELRIFVFLCGGDKCLIINGLCDYLVVFLRTFCAGCFGCFCALGCRGIGVLDRCGNDVLHSDEIVMVVVMKGVWDCMMPSCRCALFVLWWRMG